MQRNQLIKDEQSRTYIVQLDSTRFGLILEMEALVSFQFLISQWKIAVVTSKEQGMAYCIIKPSVNLTKELPRWLSDKESLANAGDTRELGSIPGGGNGHPLQYCCLENSMGRSLAGYSPGKELDLIEHTHIHKTFKIWAQTKYNYLSFHLDANTHNN